MTQRKLSQNQRRRIEKKSEKRIENASSSDIVSPLAGETDQEAAGQLGREGESLGPEQPGRIMAHYGQTLEVQDQEGLIFKCFARQNLGLLVTGDQVIFCLEKNQEKNSGKNLNLGVITARLPRKSFLQRPDIHKGQKGIAANIDQLFLVIAVNPPPIEQALDRALVSAHSQDIPVIIILNKTDLLNPTTPLETLNYFKKLIQRYEKIGYEILELGNDLNPKLSIKERPIKKLLEKIKNKTSIFVGQSGVGKSSLINKIFNTQIPDLNLDLEILDTAKTGDISSANQKGRHTTTTARLYPINLNLNLELDLELDLNLKLNPETCLIDSPGIREFGLWDLSPQDLIQGFIEFAPYINQCQFRNCSHQENAKGCALLKAVQEHKISQERLSSYFKLLAEVKN